MNFLQMTQNAQATRKNSSLYNSSNNSHAETATDENGFSYKDLLEEFQDQRNMGKNQQDQAQAKQNQQTPIKEASAADMLGNLSRMAGNFNVVSNAVLGSGAKKQTVLSNNSFTSPNQKIMIKNNSLSGTAYQDKTTANPYVQNEKNMSNVTNSTTESNLHARAVNTYKIDYGNNLNANIPMVTKVEPVLGAEAEGYVTVTLSNGSKLLQTQGRYQAGNSMPVTTMVSVYDNLGESHEVPVYFVRQGETFGNNEYLSVSSTNDWIVSLTPDATLKEGDMTSFEYVDDNGVKTTVNMPAFKIKFDMTGEFKGIGDNLKKDVKLNIKYEGEETNIPKNQSVNVDFSRVTQFAGHNTIGGTSYNELVPIVTENTLSYSEADVDLLSRYLVESEDITDKGTFYKFDMNNNGELTTEDLRRVADMVYSDQNGDGIFDERDAAALRNNPDKADIVEYWDKHNVVYNEKIAQIERDKQNEEFIKESEKIKNDLNNIDWYEPVEPTPEPEPEPEELPVLKFDELAGDITGDGVVDEKDLFMIERKILNNYSSGIVYQFPNQTIRLNDNMITNMDINKDGVVDEVDFSIAYNLSIGKEMHGMPGSSKDNPRYIINDGFVDKYVSNSIEGEYISEASYNSENVTHGVYYVSQGDTINFHNGWNDVVMSNIPHTSIIPYGDIYIGNNDEKMLYTNTEIEVTIDNDGKTNVKSLENGDISLYGDNISISRSTGSYTYVDGKNSIIRINSVDNAHGSKVSVWGENCTIIRDGGNDKDSFSVGGITCEIQNNDDSPFIIVIYRNGLQGASVKNINGIPTIIGREGSPIISLKGKINGDILIKYATGESLLKDLPGADEIFKPNENNLIITTNPDNPDEWFKSYTQILNSDETFDVMDYDGNVKGKVTVSGGNEVTLTKAYDKIVLVTPNLIVEGGSVTDTKGLAGLKVDGKEYVKNSEGKATYTKEGDKLKIVANGPFDIETTDYGDNIEISAFNGNNNITFNGKNGVVNTGHGNDEIKIKGSGNIVNTGNGNDTVEINGADSRVYLNSGENSVTMNAPSLVFAGSGKDKFNVNTSGATIMDFNPNEDSLGLSLSFGKLTAKVRTDGIAYPTILIQNEETGRTVCALVNCTDLGKINDIVNNHNQEVTVQEARDRIDELERDFAEKLGALVQEEISSDSTKAKAELIEELKKNITKNSSIPAEDFEMLKNRIAEEAADIIASKPEITKDVLTNGASMVDFFSKMFTKKEFSEGKYTITMDGFGDDAANVFQIKVSWKDNGKEESVFLGLPATEKGIKTAISNLIKAGGEVIDEQIDKATKEVISALTGVDKKIISNVYDLGTSILEMLITGKTNNKQIAESLANIGKETLESAIYGMIDRFGATSRASNAWIETQKGKVKDLIKNMNTLNKIKNSLSSLSNSSESNLKNINKTINDTTSLLSGLFELK